MTIGGVQLIMIGIVGDIYRQDPVGTESAADLLRRRAFREARADGETRHQPR